MSNVNEAIKDKNSKTFCNIIISLTTSLAYLQRSLFIHCQLKVIVSFSCSCYILNIKTLKCQSFNAHFCYKL